MQIKIVRRDSPTLCMRKLPRNRLFRGWDLAISMEVLVWIIFEPREQNEKFSNSFKGNWKT